MNLTKEPLFVVTIDNFEEDDEIEDPVYETDWHNAKMMYLGMEQSHQHPGITTASHAVYTDPNEANREAIRRLRNRADAINRKIAELEAESKEE